MHKAIQTFALSSLLIVLAGCQQFYNGLPESASKPTADDPAHNQTQAKADGPADQRHAAGRSMARRRGQRPEGQVQTVAMDRATPPSRMHMNGPMGQAEPAAGAPKPRMNSRHQTRPLQLWGQLADGKPRQWQGLDAARNVQQMTAAGEGADFDPVFDPNTQTLVFASTRHRQTADLYRTPPGGQAMTQLTSDPANDLMPTISPDGEKIAFASDRAGNWDIYLMDAAGGGNVVRVTSNPAHDLHPSFSPDGERLVYSSFSQRAGQWQLVVRELDTHGSRQILGEGLFPVWAPEGDRILYQRARQRGTRWFSVWSISYKDGKAGAPTELAAAQEAALITPTWGPQGEKIVFCTVGKPTADEQTRPRRADLWMMDASGGHRTRLTGGRFANLQPTWGADGRVYFVSDRGEPKRDGIWSMQPTQMPQPAAQPAKDEQAAPDAAEEAQAKANAGADTAQAAAKQ